jgi:bifunctional non-homologous end joining protein LigD
MLAHLVDPRTWSPGDPDDWTYERKLDGLRCIAVRDGARVDLWSRNHNSFSARFEAIGALLADLPTAAFAVDGEIVAFDGEDFAGFGELQQPGRTMLAVYCAFDILHLLGRDTTAFGLGERKQLLRTLMEPTDRIVVVEPLAGTPSELLRDACARGWEGLVAKRAGSRYVSGRSADWCKLKCSASQELVIGGWTEPQGTRSGLGALLVGYYEGDQLRYAGKVGTGFSDATLRTLADALGQLEQPTSSFADPVKEKGAHWVSPELVAAVSFSEWTRDGRLRHPSFDGLRPDKQAREVVRERPG